MNEYNTYPVFVADQVLTAEHLNQVVNYLDEQGRLTRNRLIGIGIVCGLELNASPDRIEISKGCGISSEGYLILQDRKVCTYFRPYSLPEYFSPEYKPVYEHWQMWELMSAEESLEVEDPHPLKGSGDFLRDKVVVLLLEMKEKPLKNCTEIDCEDKGERIEFRVKPLLVPKGDLDGPRPAIPDRLRRGIPVAGTRAPGASGPAGFKLRRFNVPALGLKNTNDVFGAFLKIVNENTLKELTEALNACYHRYQPVLGGGHNPFEHIAAHFNDILSHVKAANPFFIQYFYDWIDDIVKAYNELECRIFDVQMVCCPDRDLFPLHLMLGEAGRSTADLRKAPYRHYFTYSPLFNGQKDLLDEVKLLFQRLVAIIESFRVPDPRTLFTTGLKITPSRNLYAPLSQRCIPYYYEPGAMYPVWSWEKTRRGLERSNLSYHAGEYSSADTVLNPLNYDIEAADFFRVEGHIGKPVSEALPAVITQRDEFNLPFEVLALSTATVSAFFDAGDHDCHFRDLESLYKVLLAEMKCKFGEFECKAAKVPYLLRLTTGGGTTAGVAAAAFRPGDFLRSHCQVEKGSVGEAYLNTVARRNVFNRINPLEITASMAAFARADSGRTKTGATADTDGSATAAATVNFDSNGLYTSLFYFIHSVELLMEVVIDKDLEELDIELFLSRYETLIDAAADLARVGDVLESLDTGNDNYQALLDHLHSIGFYELAVRIHALVHVCIDDRMRALKKEYQRRVRELRLLTNLMHYAKKHPGMEHKAGVPKGGTFILVYHETPSRRALADLHFSNAATRESVAGLREAVMRRKKQGLERLRDLEHLRNPAGKISAREEEEMDRFIRDAYIDSPELLRNFEKALGRFMNTCRDMDDTARDRIRGILRGIPREEEPLNFQVPEEAVIADFYLPYICCSDCAPVSYVLPVPPREALSIKIKPTEFCNDDTRLYPVTVSPAGGELTASAGGLSKENNFAFSPNGLKAGVNTLTYTLADGRSTSIDLVIMESFPVSFQTQDLGDLTIQFTPGFAEDNWEVVWDFGDGSTSTEFSPAHTYKFAGQEASFVVTLRVSNAPCSAEAEQTLTVRKPADPEFDLQPRIFCIKDKNEYEFEIEPFPENLTDISNKDRLIMAIDQTAKKLVLAPSRHRIRTTKDYHLEYLGIGLDVRIVVPDASFIMQIRWVDVDNILVLRAKQTDASSYNWTVSQGNVNHSFHSPTVEARQSELKLNPGRDIIISLQVDHKFPSGKCTDQQQFTLTPELFKKYHGNGEEFDNKTIQ